MLEFTTSIPLDKMAAALRRAATGHPVRIQEAGTLADLCQEHELSCQCNGLRFRYFHRALYSALLEQWPSVAPVLPLHVVALEQDQGCKLLAPEPTKLLSCLGLPNELQAQARELEDNLIALLATASKLQVAELEHPLHETLAAAEEALGATEEQVSVTRIVPQRIDDAGSKVEEIAGTGQHDAPGG